MATAMIRCAVAVAALVLSAGMCLGQESTAPTNKTPVMSNDDMAAHPQTAADVAEIKIKTSKAPRGLPAGWLIYSADDCGFSIGLPGALKGAELAVPDQLADLVLSEKHYIYKDRLAEVFAIHLVTSVELPPARATQAFIDQIHPPGVEDLKFTIGEGSGWRTPIKGTYTETGKPHVLEGFVHIRGKHFWLVGADYERNNAEASQEARRVVAAVRFAGPCGEN
jgi:hypothetical protein